MKDPSSPVQQHRCTNARMQSHVPGLLATGDAVQATTHTYIVQEHQRSGCWSEGQNPAAYVRFQAGRGKGVRDSEC